MSTVVGGYQPVGWIGGQLVCQHGLHLHPVVAINGKLADSLVIVIILRLQQCIA